MTRLTASAWHWPPQQHRRSFPTRKTGEVAPRTLPGPVLTVVYLVTKHRVRARSPLRSSPSVPYVQHRQRRALYCCSLTHMVCFVGSRAHAISSALRMPSGGMLSQLASPLHAGCCRRHSGPSVRGPRLGWGFTAILLLTSSLVATAESRQLQVGATETLESGLQNRQYPAAAQWRRQLWQVQGGQRGLLGTAAAEAAVAPAAAAPDAAPAAPPTKDTDYIVAIVVGEFLCRRQIACTMLTLINELMQRRCHHRRHRAAVAHRPGGCGGLLARQARRAPRCNASGCCGAPQQALCSIRGHRPARMQLCVTRASIPG